MTSRDGGNAKGLSGTILAQGLTRHKHMTSRDGGNAKGLSGTNLVHAQKGGFIPPFLLSVPEFFKILFKQIR